MEKNATRVSIQPDISASVTFLQAVLCVDGVNLTGLI